MNHYFVNNYVCVAENGKGLKNEKEFSWITIVKFQVLGSIFDIEKK